MYIHGMLENAIDVNRCTRPTKKSKNFISHINLCRNTTCRSFSTRLKKKSHFNHHLQFLNY